MHIFVTFHHSKLHSKLDSSITSSSQFTMDKTDGGLKHLGFVMLMATNTVLVLSKLYNYAKQNSGPLKSSVGVIENAVTTVVGPVYQKTKRYPEDALQFVDKKVDELAPPLAKKGLDKVDQVVQNALEAGNNFVQEVKLDPHNAIDFVSSSTKKYAVYMLHVLGSIVNSYPVLKAGKDMALPTVSHLSEEYNRFIAKMPVKGYLIFSYFPRVPIDDIVEAFKPVESRQVQVDSNPATENSVDSNQVQSAPAIVDSAAAEEEKSETVSSETN